MKKIKLLILCCLVLFLSSGCSCKYEIEIYNNTVNEKITTTFPELAGSGKVPSDYLFEKLIEKEASSSLFFRKTKDVGSDTVITTYKGSFSEFSDNLSGIITCYDLYKINDVDGVITILTSNKFNCFNEYDELNTIELMIKSNHKLIETNADRVDGYKYYWTINKETSDNEKILLKLDSKKKVFNYENEFVKKLLIGGGIILGILIVSSICYNFFINKNNKVNEL